VAVSDVTPNDLAERRRAQEREDTFGEYAVVVADVETIFQHFQASLRGQDTLAAATLTLATIMAYPPEDEL